MSADDPCTIEVIKPEPAPGIVSPWLTEQQAAAYLGNTPRTLCTWRCIGKGPAFIKVGRAVRYHRDQLDQFILNGGRA